MVAIEICVGFVILVLIFLAAFYAVSVFNGLISLRNNIDKAWSNIDVLLKKRFDLIPNLVETVKGYRDYEKTVMTDITKIRSSMMQSGSLADRAKASDVISSSLKTLFAVAENYPDLKASEEFMNLQNELTAIENQISERREFYNDSVMLYNTRIHSLPDLFVAMILGFKDKEYFKADEEDKEVVQVKLDDEEQPPPQTQVTPPTQQIDKPAQPAKKKK